MPDKAKRELKRLESAAPPDETPYDDFKNHVFNFFVTACHFADYMDGDLQKEARKDDLLSRCGDAGNKAKYMELTRSRPDPKTPKHYHVFIGGTERDSVTWNIEWPDGTSREVVSFAREVIAKWQAFFASHAI